MRIYVLWYFGILVYTRVCGPVGYGFGGIGVMVGMGIWMRWDI